MRSIPVDEVVRLAEYFVNQEWPLTREQGYAACEALGWPGTGDGGFIMPYGLKPREQASMIAGTGDEGVAQVQFWLTDAVIDASDERDTFMSDFFSSSIKEIRDIWGKGKMKRTKMSHAAHWDTSNGCHLILRNSWQAVTFRLYSPEYTEVLKSLGDL
ncbi:MAG: DUF6301 family protein [Propionibacteriaceae bacterium]|nr:DUF6301 family protein [Propionibacteriaceae bacterium]